MEPIPFHLHNGQDSPRIDYNDLDGLPDAISAPDYPFEINLTWSKVFDTLDNAAGMAFNAANGSATRLMTSGNSTAVYTFRCFGGNTQDAWHSVGSSSISSGLSSSFICYHVSAFFACGSTSVYQLTDSDSPVQNLCTVSGTTLGTIRGMDSDGTYLYILDSATSLKRFTVSGTTLTYIDTITLATSINKGIVVTATNIYGHDDSNPILTLYKFDLTGLNVSNQGFQSNSTGFPVIKQIIKGPDGGLWLNLVSFSVTGGQALNYIKRLNY